MTRKTVTKLLEFAELCVQEMWPSHQADRVFEVALELAKARDSGMLAEMRNRLRVENSND